MKFKRLYDHLQDLKKEEATLLDEAKDSQFALDDLEADLENRIREGKEEHEELMKGLDEASQHDPKRLGRIVLIAERQKVYKRLLNRLASWSNQKINHHERFSRTVNDIRKYVPLLREGKLTDHKALKLRMMIQALSNSAHCTLVMLSHYPPYDVNAQGQRVTTQALLDELQELIKDPSVFPKQEAPVKSKPIDVNDL